MPTLRHAKSGAVVNVSDATAARLGNEWQSADKSQAKPAAKATTKRGQAKPAQSDDD